MVRTLDAFFESVAWPMERIPSYGAFHILYTLIGFAVCGFAAWKLRKVSDKTANWILFSLGLLLALSEVFKQLFYYFVMMDNRYSWHDFPFQLCSVPMYLCIIAPLLKKGKLQDGMYHFMTTYNLLGGIMAFIEPSGLLHKYPTLTLHAFIWHMLLIFVGFYLIASGRYAKAFPDYRRATYTFLMLCVIAFCINLIFWNASEGSINMFYVGPRYSPLIVFKQISQNVGWYASTALYIPVVCLGAFLIYLPAHLYAKKKGLLHS